jgi:bifunctional UDP-N-acetylglucosamine pyrophosphorylase/glucosamine-1-phosphate N-acetyltransferase
VFASGSHGILTLVAEPDEQGATGLNRGTVAVVILAAGQGSRMRSSLPKPLHPVAGIPMVAHVINAANAIRPAKTILVVSDTTKDLAARLGRDDLISVTQPSPDGTGHALACAVPATEQSDWVMVLFADHPLLTGETVARFLQGGKSSGARVTVLSCLLPDASGFGRVARDEAGQPIRIVEKKDDRPEDRVGATEINSGMMLFDGDWLRRSVERLTKSSATGEYYMTELVEIAVSDGEVHTGSWPVATVNAPPEVATGVNNRVELAQADSAVRARIRHELLLNGVSIVAPETVVIDAGVSIGPETTVLSGSVLSHGTTVGSGCTVGPNAVLSGATLADGATVGSSTVVDSRLGEGVTVGQYAMIRGNSRLDAGVRIGTHAEINRATLGRGVRVGHFSYLGDVSIGDDVNIGAGVVTANYDGTDKFQTVIGDRAFIGSDTVLVAPVTIGAGGSTGAGSVVTHDVGDGETVVGVPARVHQRRQRETDRHRGDN